MSTDLSERLAALADRATSTRSSAAGLGVPPAELWRRGRRRQVRRALAATVAVAAVSAIAGIGGATAWQRVETVGPVTSPDDTMRLPDRLYNPGPWLEGTDEAGPIGPLVAVIGADRRSWRSRSNGLVGVSGTTGEYRFLDLPDVAILNGEFPSAPALSPDGTMLAYWTTGSSADDPLIPMRGDRPVAGVAVYDTVTGEVHRKAVVSDHGLAPQGIAWSGDTVWANYFTFNEGGVEPGGYGSTFGGELTWSPATEEWATQTDFARSLIADGAAIGTESFVTAASRGKGYVEVGPRGEVRRFRLDAKLAVPPYLSPSGKRVAGMGLPEDGDSQGQLLVAELPRSGTDGPVTTRQVPGVRGGAVLGWRDDTHVVVRSSAEDSHYVTVDVATGATEPLVTPPAVNWTGGTTVAADAWSGPVTDAPEPDWPMDPRTRALRLGLGVAAACVVLVLWRRRRDRA